jgi:membrane protease YdiL (CAAX protease family)
MTTDEPTSRAELATFLGLTFGVSAVFYWLLITGGGLAQKPEYVFALMWTPGTSALATRLLFHRNVRGLGWRWPATRWAVLAYLLPLAYAIVGYGAVWLTGLGGVDLARFKVNALLFVFAGSLQNLLFAAGEEIGWRGFLVPTLARTLPLGRTTLASGAIWAAWHMPLIVFADYNAGTPAWYALLCFTPMAVALSLVLAWLRLRSGSLWPAAILHASHNLYVQGFFDRVTVDTGPTRWLTGEFGAALVVTIGASAWLFWRRREAVAAR